RLRALPLAGYIPFTQDPQQHLRDMVLPVITLAAAYTGNFAKGLPHWLVLRRHAVRNALIPLVTVVGVELAGLFGGAGVTVAVVVTSFVVHVVYGRLYPRERAR